MRSPPSCAAMESPSPNAAHVVTNASHGRAFSRTERRSDASSAASSQRPAACSAATSAATAAGEAGPVLVATVKALDGRPHTALPKVQLGFEQAPRQAETWRNLVANRLEVPGPRRAGSPARGPPSRAAGAGRPDLPSPARWPAGTPPAPASCQPSVRHPHAAHPARRARDGRRGDTAPGTHWSSQAATRRRDLGTEPHSSTLDGRS